MSPWVFISYAHADATHEDYICNFAGELENELRQLLPAGTLPVFADFDSIKTGQVWSDELRSALGSCRTMICLISPRYVASDFCGKEFHVFSERVASYTQAKKLKLAPALLLPVLWAPPGSWSPEPVRRLQYTDSTLPADYPHLGLRQFMRLQSYGETYKRFVFDLATKLVEAGTEFSLPDGPPVGDFDQVPNAFAPTHRAAAAPVSGPGTVTFAFVAGKPEELQGIRDTVPYEPDGGKCWQPFWPSEKRPIGSIAAEIAGQKGLFPTEIDASREIVPQIDDATGKNNVVVIFVDPWSLHVKDYKDRLHAYDERNFRKCAVLVLRNDDEPATKQSVTDLQRLMGETFEFRLKDYKRTVQFQWPIRTMNELRTKLRTTLSALQGATTASASAQKRVNAEKQIKTAEERGAGILAPTVRGPGSPAA